MDDLRTKRRNDRERMSASMGIAGERIASLQRSLVDERVAHIKDVRARSTLGPSSIAAGDLLAAEDAVLRASMLSRVDVSSSSAGAPASSELLDGASPRQAPPPATPATPQGGVSSLSSPRTTADTPLSAASFARYSPPSSRLSLAGGGSSGVAASSDRILQRAREAALSAQHVMTMPSRGAGRLTGAA